MNAPARTPLTLDPRPLYGIGTVARLTGLKPDTLRVWERRYGLGASHKSATGRRQYTQSDLEHLQLIAALVNEGARIGEIASADRKTLEHLLRGRGRDPRRVGAPPKANVVFVGEVLCEWLDEHQGCISAVNALLARTSLERALDDLVVDTAVDMLVVHSASLSKPQMDAVDSLARRIGAERQLVVYRLGNQRWMDELAQRGCGALEFPPDPARLAFELGRLGTERDINEGDVNLGDLIKAKPRRFDDQHLRAASELRSAITCECPRHIANLLTALNEFERYSSDCSVENWQDAAVHSCIYAYTNQARHLMEKALSASLEGHEEAFESLLIRSAATLDKGEA
ncbi:MAG: MerR family transcriptional regulator [Halieaceae bacterium]|nr:MerR family transcriptional regulator [Halieaceae bacterium]